MILQLKRPADVFLPFFRLPSVRVAYARLEVRQREGGIDFYGAQIVWQPRRPAFFIDSLGPQRVLLQGVQGWRNCLPERDIKLPH